MYIQCVVHRGQLSAYWLTGGHHSHHTGGETGDSRPHRDQYTAGTHRGLLHSGTGPSLIAWGQHGAHLGPTGPRWAPCWPHELCYLGCLTTATWRCRKNFSQWERSFLWKLCCHWLKGWRQRQIAVVRQGPGTHRSHWTSLSSDQGLVWI